MGLKPISLECQRRGMVGLGENGRGGQYDSRAYAVSADGRLVGGFGTSDIGEEAVIWDYEGVMYRVKKTCLLAAGISEVADWRLEGIRAFSADRHGAGRHEAGTPAATAKHGSPSCRALTDGWKT